MNEEIKPPKKNTAYRWTLVKGEQYIDVMTKESKASSVINNLINEGYRINRRTPIFEDEES